MVTTAKTDPDNTDTLLLTVPVSKQILLENPQHTADEVGKLVASAALEWVSEQGE